MSIDGIFLVLKWIQWVIFQTLMRGNCFSYAKIIKRRFKTISETILLEGQNGLRIGRSCIDNVFIIKQTTE